MKNVRENVGKRRRGNVFLNKRGASIVIALGLVAVVMFFTIGIASTMMTALRNASNSKKALQAEYAAQSGVELALYDLAGIEPAFSGSLPTEKLTLNEDLNIYADREVVGQDDSENYSDEGWSIPPIGRGNSGIDCNAVSDDSLIINVGHPCNWNRIYFGESIDIPLYVVDRESGDVMNPNNTYDGVDAPDGAGLGLREFELVVRPPCSEVYNCSDFDRDVVAGRLNDESPSELLLSWQVSGDCFDGDESEPCSVSQIVDDAGDVTNWHLASFQEHSLNGLGGIEMVVNFFEGFAGENCADLEGVEGVASDFLNNTGGPWEDLRINRPVLKLSFINKAWEEGREMTIPYFEYQIRYTNGGAGSTFASSYSIYVDGYSDLFKYQIDGVRDMHSGLFDFAVQN